MDIVLLDIGGLLLDIGYCVLADTKMRSPTPGNDLFRRRAVSARRTSVLAHHGTRRYMTVELSRHFHRGTPIELWVWPGC